MGEEEACHLDSKCRVKLESKNGKKQCRLLSCCMCEKHFHALCINYQSLPDSEFNALKDVFTCTRCFKLVDAISCQIEERISKIFDKYLHNDSLKEVSSKIASTQTHTETQDSIKHTTQCNNTPPNVTIKDLNNNIITMKDDSLGDNDNVLTNQITDSLSIDSKNIDKKSENSIASKVEINLKTNDTNDTLTEPIMNKIAVQNNNTVQKYEATNIPIIQTNIDKNNKISNNHAIDKNANDSHKKSETSIAFQSDKNLYLCGIETILSISDIKIILEDYNVHLNTIEITAAEGAFNKKKYVNIHSSSMTDIFKFKLSFSNSSLSNAWFLRETPPKHKTYAETLSKSKDITIDYANLNRDKILLKNKIIKQKSCPNSLNFETITLRPVITNQHQNPLIPTIKTNFRNKISNGFTISNNKPPLKSFINSVQSSSNFLSQKVNQNRPK